MARKYPRFIFSNPVNTKSPGPFIVHLLAPRMIVRVLSMDDPQDVFNSTAYQESFSGFKLQLLEVFDDVSDFEIKAIVMDMGNWFKHQPEAHQIFK